MMKTIQHSLPLHKAASEKRQSIVTRFMNWTSEQEEKKMTWLAIILTGHGCFFTPFTVMMIMLTGNNPVYWPFAIGAMALCLVTNLAALPTKITIPAFIFSILMDLTIIVLAVSNGFNIPQVP